MNAPVDPVADKAAHDRATELIDGMTAQVQWIVYFKLHNEGLRVSDAVHKIEELAPRMKGKT